MPAPARRLPDVKPIEVSQVTTRADRDAFIQFSWQIYRDDPAWVPPLVLERKEFLDRKKHPFYEHGDAALFLARRGGKTVGRMMASDDPNYNALHQSNVGCFGLFESINDPAVATALFEAASAWLRAKGRTEVMGPIDYSTNYVCGLLVEGFEFPPTLLTAHNPPYYAALIEGLGFSKTMDFYAWWFAQPERAAARLRRLAGTLEKRHSITIRPGDLKNLREEGRRLREIYNEAWKDNWGFVPFTESEFDFMTKELKQLIVPEFTLFAEVAGEPAGFILCVPDINVAFKKINGRLTSYGIPIGLAKLLYHKSRIRTARLIALGVKPKYRRGGIAEMLVLRIIEDAMIKRGFTGELSMTLENNHLINRFLAAIGAKKYKTYRIYRRLL
ncbi:MAG: GNAT family N-acetyltransferase [Verrucomicrobiota bacterium]|nr:GNAT family N-acetyltransferase [Verrucomicrobiota bacterium]